MAAERLARWLARSGVASRRGAERLLASGRVTVDGAPVPVHGRLVDPDREEILVDGRAVSPRSPERRYLALHKPVGVVSSARDPEGRETVLDLVGRPRGVFPVGRLDRDSAGLVLLTDDGDLALHLTHPRYQVEKVYLVAVEGPVSPSQLASLRAGPLLDDGPTHPLRVELLRSGARRSRLSLRLAEGRRRQVRRMCAKVGLRVLELRRVEIGGLRLGTLPEGQCRELGGGEVRRLRARAGLR